MVADTHDDAVERRVGGSTTFDVATQICVCTFIHAKIGPVVI